MSDGTYTVLITESPVLAGLLQKQLPSSVYVIATSGYCWRPVYDPDQNNLKAIADLSKRELRKEIRDQASAAGNIIIATDSDPSGDFICWSVASFLKMGFIKRSYIRDISRSGAVGLISEAETVQTDDLEQRLKSRYLIRHKWNSRRDFPAFDIAALSALFSAPELDFTLFSDREGRLYQSHTPLRVSKGEWIPVQEDRSEEKYSRNDPHSTFDLIPEMVRSGISESGTDAQLELQQLFQTTLTLSGESLISYPRTSCRAFYSSTWDHLRRQYLMFGELNELRPQFLEAIADSSEPHESVRPLNLKMTPESVRGELSSAAGRLYQLIYSGTLNAIRMPERLELVYLSGFHPDTHFYPMDQTEAGSSQPEALRPILSPSQLGHSLFRLGALKPSRFGRKLDEWLGSDLVRVNGHEVSSGPALRQYLSRGSLYRKILTGLKSLTNEKNLSPETVSRLISS